jgi:hypothetical protein
VQQPARNVCKAKVVALASATKKSIDKKNIMGEKIPSSKLQSNDLLALVTLRSSIIRQWLPSAIPVIRGQDCSANLPYYSG